jgi:hypothetical protein
MPPNFGSPSEIGTVAVSTMLLPFRKRINPCPLSLVSLYSTGVVAGALEELLALTALTDEREEDDFHLDEELGDRLKVFDEVFEEDEHVLRPRTDGHADVAREIEEDDDRTFLRTVIFLQFPSRTEQAFKLLEDHEDVECDCFFGKLEDIAAALPVTFPETVNESS